MCIVLYVVYMCMCVGVYVCVCVYVCVYGSVWLDKDGEQECVVCGVCVCVCVHCVLTVFILHNNYNIMVCVPITD